MNEPASNGAAAMPAGGGLARVLEETKTVLFQAQLLTQKNAYVHRRNLVATGTQTLIGMIFIALLRLLQYSADSSSFSAATLDTPRPIPVPAHSYATCHEAGPCHPFVYAPKGDDTLGAWATETATAAAAVLGYPAAGTEGGPIGLASESLVDAWLIEHPAQTMAALIFNVAPGNDPDAVPLRASYTVQANTTIVCEDLDEIGCSDPTLEIIAPLRAAVDSAIMRGAGKPTATITTSFSDVGHPALERTIAIMRRYAPTFLYIVFLFNFVVQLTNIVAEKESKLRASMEQMGMRPLAHWLAWFVTTTTVNMMMVAILILSGIVFDLDMFKKTSFGVYFLHLLLSATGFTFIAFWISTLVRTTELARSISIMLYIFTFITFPILVSLYLYSGKDKDKEISAGIALIPGVPFFKGVFDMVALSDGPDMDGISWDERDTSAPGDEGIFTMERTWLQLVYGCLILGVCTWYCDNTIPNEYGARRSLLFFLSPSYWGLGGRAVPKPAIDDEPLGDDIDSDVKVEALAVRSGDFGSRSVAVTVQNLQKHFTFRKYEILHSNSWAGALLYPLPLAFLSIPMYIFFAIILGVSPWGFGLKLLPTNEVTTLKAVDGTSFAIDENQLFVLLGHNGAGKSTTFNVLCGLMPSTGGLGRVFGMSIDTDQDAIRSILGVCPQHDVLFDQMSGREHLDLFARLKGIAPENVAAEVEARLADVLLTNDADVLAGAYSGGMRRRLSIAIALLGDPKIVFLDEPTTGMDPVTRRQVWDMIQRAKKGRCIILTTHAMEEAEILGDRVAVMSHGKLQALGTALHLKNKFGGGFRLTLFTSETGKAEPDKAVVDFVRQHIPGTEMKSFIEGSYQFVMPELTDATVAPKFFRALDAARDSLNVTDVSVGMATLEDVFINLAIKDDAAEKQGDDDNHVSLDAADEEQGSLVVGCIKPNSCFGKCFLGKRCCGCGSCSSATSRRGKNTIPTGTEMTPFGGGDNATPEHEALTGGDADGSAATKAPGAQETVRQQFSALFSKSLSYQKRQTKQMACLIIFPCIFIVGIWVLNEFAVGPIDARIERKTDLDCMADLFLKTYHLPSKFGVGAISELNECSGTSRRGDDDEGSDPYLCNSYEQPDYEVIVGAPAGVEIGQLALSEDSEQVEASRTWYRELQTLLLSQGTCDLQFESAIDAAPKLAQAMAWRDGVDGQNLGTASCQIKKNSQTEGRAEPPGEKWFDMLAEIEADLAECEGAYDEALEAHWGSTAFGAPAANPSTSGMLENLSFFDFEDPLVGDYVNNILFAGFEEVAETVVASLAPSSPTDVCAAAADPTESCYIAAVAADEGSVDECVDSETATECYDDMEAAITARAADFASLAPHMTSATEIFSGFAVGRVDKVVVADLVCAQASKAAVEAAMGLGSAAAERFCEFVSRHSDFVGLHTTTYTDRDAVAKAFYDTWFGEQYVVESLDEVTIPYATAKVGGYWFDAYDEAAGTSDVTIFVNVTGSGGPPWAYSYDRFVDRDSNMFALQTVINRALVLQAVGIEVAVDSKTMPVLFDKTFIMVFGGESLGDYIALYFITYTLMIYMFIIVGLVVFEKVAKLREIMVMSGLKMATYWTVQYLFYMAQYILMVTVLWIASSVIELKLFTLHDAGVLVLFFFVWGNLMIAFSFMLSSLFSNVRTAVACTFLFIVICVECGFTMLFLLIYNEETPKSAYIGYNFLPPMLLLRGMIWLSVSAGTGNAITAENWATVGDGALLDVVLWMVGLTAGSLLLLWYFENTVNTGIGVKKHPLFFLGFQTDTGTAQEEEAGEKLPKPDVEAERARVYGSEASAVRILALRKVFPGRGGAPPKIAVDSLSLGIERSECFGLLGHNGAGKTTAINMLCGLFSPTSGDAFVLGHSITTALSKVYHCMASCPQDNVLWDDLTGREHMRFYGRLRGLKGQALTAAIDSGLEAVNLTRFSGMLSKQYSGGMKRRLSVACALVGGAEVVYLDEPSTGLDPASRQKLWHVIANAKATKSIVLTTHSLEEADVLCDRVAIMAEGCMQCIGRAAELKKRYGAGFKLSIHTESQTPDTAAEVAAFVKGMCPDAILISESMGGTSDFEIAGVKLHDVFEKVEHARETLQISDWGITETTLEEVFLKVSLGNYNAVAKRLPRPTWEDGV